MFKHLLVPIGRLNEAEAALDIALELASRNQATISLLHIVELIQDMPYEEHRDFYDGLARQAELDLQLAKSRLDNLKTSIKFGKRVREILNYAETSGVDLIVLQSHPIDLTDPTRGWGTISYRVALLSKCPVMLVKNG